MRIAQWWTKRDSGAAAAKRALKAVVVVGGNFTIASQIFRDAPMATFAAFGSFALMMFANFPGTGRARAGDYLGLGILSAALISIGTVAARPNWLAVAATLVIAFGVLFAGVVSSVINGGTQAALLTFLLAVLLPGGAEVLPDRLAGWGLAVVVAVPVNVFVWPPDDADRLRSRAAEACRTLADLLALRRIGSADPVVAVAGAMTALRNQFRVTAVRFTSLSSANRLVIRLVDELEWLSTTVLNACADAPEGWPPKGRALRASAAELLTAAGGVLAATRPTAAGELTGLIERLRLARIGVAAETLAALRRSAAETGSDEAVAGEFERPLYAAHELGYTVTLAGETVRAIARADARTWWDRLLGRNRPLDDDPEPSASRQAGRMARNHLTSRSVWWRNSIRGAVGLALAVTLARLFDAQNAFWIGLGALSVLRSNALSTGTIAVRALLGTLLGFAVGGALVAAIGTNHAVLWPLLPVAIFVAGVAPAMISFMAGQAAFTVFSIVLFNLLAPIGWRIGIVRVEDVALGCLASLVAGVLFWPRGSAHALSGALAEAYRSGADYLHRVITGLLSPEEEADPEPPNSGATHRLDDAFRQYLAEAGAKRVPLASIVALTNGAARLHLAGLAVLGIRTSAAGVEVSPEASVRSLGLEQPAQLLHREVDAVQGWFRELADIFRGAKRPVPQIDSPQDSFLDAVLPVIDRCGDPDRAAGAEQLLWAGQYLGDVDRFRQELVEPAGQVSAALAEPWWHR